MAHVHALWPGHSVPKRFALTDLCCVDNFWYSDLGDLVLWRNLRSFSYYLPISAVTIIQNPSSGIKSDCHIHFQKVELPTKVHINTYKQYKSWLKLTWFTSKMYTKVLCSVKGYVYNIPLQIVINKGHKCASEPFTQT